MDNQQSNAWGQDNNTIEYRISSPPQVNNISSTVDPGRPISSQSNNVIHKNANNLVGVQSKFRRRYYHKVLFGSLILLILILLIVIIVLAFRGRNSRILCETKDCLRSASNILLSMDETVDPCEDFYQFTCGKWGEEHPRPDSVTSYDWFSEKQGKILRHVRTFLQQNSSEDDPKAVVKTRTMYKACMDEQTLDDLAMKPILKFFKEFKLPLNPTALNVTSNSEDLIEEDQKSSFNFINSIVQIKRVLTMDVILGFDIFSDPFNGTINRLVVGTPESGSPLPFTNKKDSKRYQNKKKRTILSFEPEADEDESEEELTAEEKKIPKEKISAYLSYLKNVVSMYYSYIDKDSDPEDTMNNISKPLNKYVEISKQFYKFQEMAENISLSSKTPMEDLLFLNLSQLINQTKSEDNKSIDWKTYLEQMLSGSVQNLSISNEIILTSKADIVYLQAVTEYLNTLQVEYIELYIWMTIFEELILHTTRELRSIHHLYMNLIISTEGSTPRSLYCTNGLNNLLGMATSYSLADKSFETYTLPKVKSMLKDIRDAFNNLVKSTSWMDKPTKYETLEKSNAMKSFIGFPDWVLNKTTLDEFYGDITANETTHLDNLVNILRWEMKTKLHSLKLPNKFGWASAPSTVNAYHTFQANAITIPIAILQYPFYNLGIEALNYGAIGTVLGHELTHGFDDSGRMFDKMGNMRQWWTNATINEYINRTECFIDQYSKYYLEDIDEYIDGELTLGENIADNGGLREAYYAYLSYAKRSGREQYLPGLEKYTHEQLLFISFGNLWCETLTEAGSKYAIEDTHSPGRFRLKGVLTNSHEFSKAFNCKIGSGMNPKHDRCIIW